MFYKSIFSLTTLEHFFLADLGIIYDLKRKKVIFCNKILI